MQTLGNLYLDHQEARVTAGEIKPRQPHDQKMLWPRQLNTLVSDQQDPFTVYDVPTDAPAWLN